MRVAIAGSSGSIGSALRSALAGGGHEVVRLLRRPPAAGSGDVEWDPAAGRLDPEALAGVDVVVNLAGVSIGDARFTERLKRQILDSRLDTTGLLARTMAAMEHPPPVLINASAIGFYGERGDEILTEESGRGTGFLSDVTVAWEEATAPAAAAGIRVVHLRTGIVLDRKAGALGRMLLPYRLGIGGRLGSGRQWWSWISLRDEVAAIVHLMTSDLAGPVNLTAPSPVTNSEFVAMLGRVLRRPVLIPVPRFALRLLLGRELADALVFTSARVLPKRLLDDGFEFSDPGVESGLRTALDRPA